MQAAFCKMFGRLSLKRAVMVGTFDINFQNGIKNSSLIIFSED